MRRYPVRHWINWFQITANSISLLPSYTLFVLTVKLAVSAERELTTIEFAVSLEILLREFATMVIGGI